MKIKLFFLIFQLSFTSVLHSQIKPAPSDKAVVYFVRVSGLGSLIKFKLFDGDQIIAKIRANSYFRYECMPGEHLLWCRGENSIFADAVLEPGKIYVIDVIPQVGLAVARVRLQPVDPDNYKLKRIIKTLSKKELRRPTPEDLAKWQNFNKTQVIPNGLKGYEYDKKRNKVPILKPSWTFEVEDLSRKRK